MPFKIGAIVRLKRDPGHRMLVVDEQADWVVCQWFDGKATQQSAFSGDDIEVDTAPLGRTAPT